MTCPPHLWLLSQPHDLDHRATSGVCQQCGALRSFNDRKRGLSFGATFSERAKRGREAAAAWKAREHG